MENVHINMFGSALSSL